MTGEEVPIIAEPADALPSAALAELPEAMQLAAARAGWSELMPVQARALPYLRAGRDLMVQSRTGSGKTGAYLLPMLERLDPRRAEPQALVLVPTRELARQVAGEAELLLAPAGLRNVAVYGGVGYGPQLDALRQGAHVVIGTPGRVLDHLLRRALRLDGLRILILDEADRMLSMGFYPDMERVKSYLPEREISTYLFSATFPEHVLGLARRFLRQQDLLSLSRDHVHVTAIDHIYYEAAAMDKDRALIRILEAENPPTALIFANTRQRVHYLAVVLQRFGFDAAELSSDLSQVERQEVLNRLREGKLRFLVATDVAARGLDIPALSHVILYEIPDAHEDYIHRSGRTGRAGAGGTAISVVSGLEAMALQRIAHAYGIALEERILPTETEVETLVAERATVLLEAALRDRDRLLVERLERFKPLARSLAANEEGQALLAMLLDDFYHLGTHGLPAPVSLEPSSSPQPKRARRRRRGSARDT